MNIEEYRDYCLSLNGVTEDFPFGEQTLVFRVGDKMFALANIDEYKFVNLKCDPDEAVILREQYEGISPGWHMSKKHWNSVATFSDVDDELFKKLIKDSYDLVVKSLPKKEREKL